MNSESHGLHNTRLSANIKYILLFESDGRVPGRVPTSCGPCDIFCTESIKIAKKLKLSNGEQAFNKHTS